MQKTFAKLMSFYLSDTRGSTTIEWVGITAVTFLAAILISGFLLESADGLGGAVAGQMDNAAAAINGTQGGS